MINIKNRIAEAISKQAIHYGLIGFKVHDPIDTPDKTVTIVLTKEIDIDRSDLILSDNATALVCKRIYDSLFLSIENSEFVEDIKKNQQEEINHLKCRIDELDAEIEKLKQFKTYFDLEYTLRNGKEDLSCKK